MGSGTVKRLIMFAALAVSACATPRIVYRDRPVEVRVPVAQPCVSGVRPTMPKPLNEQFTAEQWKALDPKQKAALVGRQALALKTYGESLNAATAACP